MAVVQPIMIDSYGQPEGEKTTLVANPYIDDVDSSDGDDETCCGSCTKEKCCAYSCCSVCCVLVIYVMIGLIGGKFFVHTPVGWGWAEGLTACNDYWCGPGKGLYLSPANLTRYLRYGGASGPPVGYKTNASLNAIKCYSAQQIYDMEAFNTGAPWEAVYFNSRADTEGKSATVKLMAWLLKTPVKRAPFLKSPPPRIVLQHGVGSNQNNRFTQYLAYQLRSMGFDVLVPGFRNHGWSGTSEHNRCTWGWTYPLDLLGAWDYAVADPEGKFGGAADPKLVGIAGVSLGAMTTATAFGMEKRVHAAWIDSGPADPYTELEAQIGMIPNPLRAMLMPGVYRGAEWWSGVDLSRYIPPKYLPCTNASYIRHAAVVSSSLDTFVPIDQMNTLIDLIAGSPKCYALDTVYAPHVSCGGMYHGYEMYIRPDAYRLRLCHFFTKAFSGLTCDYCKLQELPWYTILDPAKQKSDIAEVCGTA